MEWSIRLLEEGHCLLRARLKGVEGAGPLTSCVRRCGAMAGAMERTMAEREICPPIQSRVRNGARGIDEAGHTSLFALADWLSHRPLVRRCSCLLLEA